MSAIAPLRRARPAAGSSRPSLQVVDEPVTRHTLVYGLAVVLLLSAAVFGTVTLNALAAAAAVEARELDARVAEGERVYAQLVADVATLEDPGRIREEALALGMVPAGPGRQIALERALPADGAVPPTEVGHAGPDPLKPVLSVER